MQLTSNQPTHVLLSLTLPIRYINKKEGLNILYSSNNFMIATNNRQPFAPEWIKRAKDDLCFKVRKMMKNVSESPLNGSATILLVIYRETNHLVDIDNFYPLEKFATDTIVKSGKILPDDNFNYITGVTVRDGGLDKENPRAEYFLIKDMEN